MAHNRAGNRPAVLAIRLANRLMDRELLIALWRARAEEAQAAQMKGGSISQELLLSIAASYLRLVGREARDWDLKNAPLL